MVYLEPAAFGWRPLLLSWLNDLPQALQEHRPLIMALVDWLVDPCLRLVFSKLKELVATSESNLTRSLMYLFEMLMADAVKDEKAAKENKALKSWIVVCAKIHWSLHDCYIFQFIRIVHIMNVTEFL